MFLQAQDELCVMDPKFIPLSSAELFLFAAALLEGFPSVLLALAAWGR